MRSLASKLTLAFLLVGVIGVVATTVLSVRSTRTEVTRYLSTRDQDALVNALSGFYEGSGSWTGVDQAIYGSGQLSYYSRSAIVTDDAGVVLLKGNGYEVGQVLAADRLSSARQVRVSEQTVGYVLFVSRADDGPPNRIDDGKIPGYRPPPGASPEDALINRVGIAAALSGAIAALLALVLGIVLARTFTRPVRALIDATQAMAAGKLGQTVAVNSRDEIGQLAVSFNRMSSDLARASQARKQMTADLAHDLRTPLSILRGYTEGLQDGRLQGSPEVFTVMHGEVQHLQRLVEDLRTLSLADAGELPLNRRTVDPVALLERAGLAHMIEAERRGVTLRVTAAEDLPAVSVDTDRMAQVLNNLVSNALQHTPQGEVVLSAAASDGIVRLGVRDSGSGILPEDLPHVFDRFYRGDKSRQRTGEESSGLGLAIAKAIVEAHGGSISVTSAPDKGATVTVSLRAR
jgi:two-component system, OmpR family, sensor histidine kinase BaeS